jgi:hypothetical protein
MAENQLTLFQEIFIFIIVFILFLPLLAKSIRLATTAWENREDLEKTHLRKILILIPSGIIIAFILTFIFVSSLFRLIVF